MTFAIPAMNWLFWGGVGAALMMVVGVMLTLLGRRGRRIDDHPVCRKCGYDLTGRPETSTRCAECGADLSRARAVRMGNRIRLRRPIWIGVCLTVLSMGLGGATIWLYVSATDLNQYKPLWLLRGEVSSTLAATRASAAAEVTRRLRAGELSDAQVQTLISEALRVQADSSSPAWQQWENMVCAIDAAGKIGDADWIAFIRQGLKMSFVTRPQIRAGDPLPLALRLDQSRLPYQGRGNRGTPRRGLPMGEFEWVEARLEDRPVGLLPSTRGTLPQKTSFSGNADFRELQQQSRAYKVRFDQTQTSGLAEGTHPVITRFKVHVRDVRRNAVIGTFELRQTTMVNFLPADTPDERLFVQDSALQQQMERAITKVQVSATRPGHVYFQISHDKAPMALTHKIYVRSANGNEALMFPWMLNRGGGPGSLGMSIAADLSGLVLVDVVIRPDLEGLLESTLPERVWGGEIVIRNVPINRQIGGFWAE